MRTIGTIAEIWRYPVKSMRGERLQVGRIGPGGIAGDRGWAVRDERVGEIRGAKHIPKLMMCSARYLDEPRTDSIPAVEILLPDGEKLLTCDPAANAKLSAFLGRDVTLWPLRPVSDSAHYRRVELLDSEKKVKRFLSREDGDTLPQLVGYPYDLLGEVTEFVSPRGTYFDLAPLHVLTTSTLRKLAARGPSLDFDVRRFRPNLLVATSDDEQGYVEFEWTGQRLGIGALTLECGAPTIRCGMTTHEQIDLPREPRILRTIVHEGQNVGIYARSPGTGEVRTGDVAALL